VSFGLFHVLAGLGRSIPMCAGAVIYAGLRVDPNLNLWIALGCGGILRSSGLRLGSLGRGSWGRLRLLRARCSWSEQCDNHNEDRS